MRTTKTRLLSLILAVMMLVSMLPTMALAEDIVQEDSETPLIPLNEGSDTDEGATPTEDPMPTGMCAYIDANKDGYYIEADGDVAYSTYIKALRAAAEGDIVRVTADHSASQGSSSAAVSVTATLDLDGHTVRVGKYFITISTAGATVTVMNGTVYGSQAASSLMINVTGAGAGIVFDGVNVYNGTAYDADYSGTAYNGNTIVSLKGENVTLTLTNSTFKTNTNGAVVLYYASAKLKMNSSHIFQDKAAKYCVTLSSITASDNVTLDANSTLNCVTENYAYIDGITVTWPDGYQEQTAQNGAYYTTSAVAKTTDTPTPEAAFGDTDYDTLAEALAAAFEAKGGTVTLKGDVTIYKGYYHNDSLTTYSIDIKGGLENPLTLDLDGHTITTTSSLLRYQGCEQELVIRNGNVVATGEVSSSNLITLATGGPLTLEDLTITGYNQRIVRVYQGQVNDVTLDNVTVMQAVTNTLHPISVASDDTTANIYVINGSKIYSDVEAVDIQSGIESEVYLDDTSYLYHKAEAPATGETANLVASDEGYVISTTAEADANGYYTTTIKAAGTMKPKSASLSLEDIVYINFYFAMENSDLTQEYIEANGGMMYWTADAYPGNGNVVFGDATAITVPGLTYVASSSRYGVQSEGIPTAYLADTMSFVGYVKLPDGNYLYSNAQNYSGLQYLTKQISNVDNITNQDSLTDTQKAFRELCISMLNLIASAQTYENHNTDNLANANLSDDRQDIGWDGTLLTSALTPDDAKTLKRDSDVFTSRSRSVSLDGNIKMNFYFKVPDATLETAQEFGTMFWTEADYNAATTLDKESATYYTTAMTKTDDGKWGIQYSEGFASEDYEDTVYSCGYVIDANGEYHYSGLAGFSVEEYCKSKINSTSETAELIDLCKNLVNYGTKAQIYFPLSKA